MSCSKLSTGSLPGSSRFENPNSTIILEQSADFNMQNNANVMLDGIKVSVADIDKLATPDIKLDDGKHLVLNAVSDSNHICQEFDQKLSLDLKKHFTKCKTFSASTESQQSIARGISSYSRSISLPSSSSLVPALKGGRALNGITVKSDLSVKWAPDVYDPPATSMSHTLNSHNNQRPKSKKKDKRKNKGKSSRKNAMEQKHGNRKSYNKVPDPLNVRMHGSSNGGNSKGVDLYEYGFNNNKNQEVKCGSSFLMESLPKMHLSIGEAS